MTKSFDYGSIQEQFVEIYNLKGKNFHLVEATGDVAAKYRNAAIKGASLGPDGKPTRISGIGDLEPLLVSLCLFEVIDGKRQSKNVSEQFVRMLPARVQKELYDTAREISDLEETEDNEIWTEAFSRPDAPCRLEDIREWIDQCLTDDKYKSIRKALQPTASEKAKN